MSEDKSKIIIPKRATKTKLASSESVLKEGEIALIYPDTGPGTGAAKLVSGDGATVAKNLPIAIDGEAIDELRESLDIAKKIIPITLSLTGWKSANGDNSAPYVQTVINEELKSSMNPDLVSMLDESATPEEQEAYNKNLAIISQGVGTVNNGSITYKVYKLPSADITIGLTRLGGVKEVETASGVDDVKVGGISVVNNKIAEIPAIPSTDSFVSYEGATKDVDLGNHNLHVATNTVDAKHTASAQINLGKITVGDNTAPGIDATTSATITDTGSGASANLSGEIYLYPVEMGVTMTVTEGDTTSGTVVTANSEKVSVADIAGDSETQIRPGKITGLDLPAADTDAANKKYVDDIADSTKIYIKYISFSYDTAIELGASDKKLIPLVPDYIQIPEGKELRVLSLTVNEFMDESLDYRYGLTLDSEDNPEIFITTKNNTDGDLRPADKIMTVTYDFVNKIT
ncbi:hypothetical protein DW954_01820 [Clostridium sp. AM45-5]|nr:hypothetical protein [Clostridium sp. AM45-5]RHS68100.1 hypothetical protein DW954_01820 [Clostridium sp. AM45-5]